MSYKDHFPSRYLKVDDLKGRKLSLTITSCASEEVGQGMDKKDKLVVRFKETSKGLVSNRINADTIAEIVGSEDEQDWVGHKVILVPSKTEYAGKRVPCIRVEAPGGVPDVPSASGIFDEEFEEGEAS